MVRQKIDKFKSLGKREKTRVLLIFIIRLLAISVLIYAFIKMLVTATKTTYSTYVNLMIQASVLFVLTLVPTIVEKIWKVHLPFTIVIIFLFMALCAFFFGEIADFYIKFSWWDDFLHTIAGLYIAACAFFLLSILNERKDIPYKSSPGFVFLFALCVALAAEAVWEMIEYSIDGIVGANMQRAYESVGFVKNGAVDDVTDPLFNAFVGREALKDTMGDIIEVLIGALITCTIGYIALKYDEKLRNVVTRAKNRFSKDKNGNIVENKDEKMIENNEDSTNENKQ